MYKTVFKANFWLREKDWLNYIPIWEVQSQKENGFYQKVGESI